jgi:hypothetical protein
VATARERRVAASSWVRVIADGLRAGDLRAARDRAVAHGWAMRDAGVASAVLTGGLIAIERAADDAVKHNDNDENTSRANLDPKRRHPREHNKPGGQGDAPRRRRGGA